MALPAEKARSQFKRLPAAPLLLPGLLLLLFANLTSLAYATTAADEALSLFEQRALYRQALDDLRRGAVSKFRAKAKRLDNYPLRPYLDYHLVNGRLNRASTKEIRNFMDEHGDLAPSDIMFRRWLKKLGQKRHWTTLLQNFSDADYQRSRDAELRCYYVRALYGRDQRKKALDWTTDLWLSPKSQPKACDPIFDVWRTTPRFTEEIAWQRFDAAIKNNQRKLSRYLLRFFTGTNKRAAEAYYQVHTQPKRITKRSRFARDNAQNRNIIQHGLMRLSRNGAEDAAKAWARYAETHSFSPVQRSIIAEHIQVGLARGGTFPSAAERAQFTSSFATQGLAEAALAQQNWEELVYWVSHLPSGEQSTQRWQYWWARALQQAASPQLSNIDTPNPQQMLRQLAGQRHYYGFMAALSLDMPLQKLQAGTPKPPAFDLSSNASAQRAIELFAVGEDLNGRREWYRALDTLSNDEKRKLGHLARDIGNLSLAIRSANLAEAMDDLALRFPVTFSSDFNSAAHKQDVAPGLLRAVARQESAYQPAAKSPVGASGLMQLMPATAKLVAKRARLPSNFATQLNNPKINIQLGSYHLAWLIDRFEGQRPLAIAAYNAGEHRVDRWIKDIDGMPMDVWIETIPFSETRNYVKNVLAFTYVYNQLLDTPANILSSGERSVAQSS
jgi:soluble lytic murein transglycosylase